VRIGPPLASSIGSSNFRDQDMKAGYSGYSPQIIRHYGVFASNNRAESIATTRALLDVAPPAAPPEASGCRSGYPACAACPCPRCGAGMIVIETFARGCEPKWRPTPK
jgi:hypothetical protein